MGRELFDFAFKTYANRWMFKHPTPDDFFRTMEDASAFDLDWFWRGWFFTNDHVDISLDKVIPYRIDSKDPKINKQEAREKDELLKTKDIGNQRNKNMETYMDEDEGLVDFYTTYDPYEVTKKDLERYKKFMNSLNEEEKKLIEANEFYYELSFSNVGGLVMPLIIEFNFTDGTTEIVKIPAEIWKKNNENITKVFGFKKEVNNIVLDPF